MTQLDPNQSSGLRVPLGEEAKSDRIPFPEKIAYGFGDLASCLYWQTFMVYLMFFYTDIYGISPAWVGILLGVARIWDGINDPLMGAIADRTNTRWGHFRPYFIWMSLPLAVLGYLTFTTPELGPTGKLIWAFCTYNLLMMAYTAINIPYTALLGVISPNAVDRTTVSSIKFIFAFGAGTLISYFLMPMVQILGKTQEWTAANAHKIADWVALDPARNTVSNHPEMIHNLQHGWSMSFAIIGILAILFFFVTFLFTHERVKPPVNQKTNLGKDIKDLLTNGPWFIILGVTVAYVLYTAIRSSASTYYFRYFVDYKDGISTVIYPFIGAKTYDFEHLVSIFNTVGQVASIVGLLFLPFLVAFVGKKASFIIMMATGMICTGAFYLLGPDDTFMMLVLQVLGSLGGGPLAALLWAMYADTADYSDWKHGRRATGLVFSASTMSQKCGWAVAAVFVGFILSLVGYKANEIQNAQVISNLRLMMSLIPIIFGAIAIIILAFHPLNEKKMKQISDELKSRNAAAEAETPTA
jgi:glycoside/pentoside/hexuronide:cation symporter, GPH family